MKKIIARNQEVAIFQKLLKSNRAEFAAIYGRRRVGKTYLVRTFFSPKSNFLSVTGLKDGDMQAQLSIFRSSLDKFLESPTPSEVPNTWHQAFQTLTNIIKQHTSKKPFVIFLDELPWLATRRANLVQMIDHFWNTEWSLMPNVKLIVCGSAAAWMLEHIVDEQGGLHNRLTQRMCLSPFTLKESHEFLQSLGHKWSQQQLLDIYMITGGVPYYLEQLRKNHSLVQNVDTLCFKDDSPLKNEFLRLYRSLFDKADEHLAIVRLIASKNMGVSRKWLIEKSNHSSGGYLTKRLDELEAAGFVSSFFPYGKKRDVHYRLVDLYSIFYLRWIDPIVTAKKHFAPKHWQSVSQTPSWHSWCGYAFENICFLHAPQIIQALDLETLCSSYASYYLPSSGKQPGCQIDLLLERTDGAVTICEMRYSHKQYVLAKEAALSLSRKLSVFSEHIKDDTQIMCALVTPKGMKDSVWAEELIDQVLTLETLFK